MGKPDIDKIYIDPDYIEKQVRAYLSLDIKYEELDKMLLSVLNRIFKDGLEDRTAMLKEFYPLCSYMLATVRPWDYTKTMIKAARILVFILENQTDADEAGPKDKIPSGCETRGEECEMDVFARRRSPPRCLKCFSPM